MSSAKDGGPAFPDQEPIYRSGYETGEFRPVRGMSLRDCYVTHAPEPPAGWLPEFLPVSGRLREIADAHAMWRNCYADAQMEVRK